MSQMKIALWSLIGLLLVGGATDTLAASVTLAWDAEAGLRYMVFYGTEPGKYTRSVDAKDQHSIVINGLADRQVYYFAIRSYDERGQMSDFSPEVSKLAVESPAPDQKAPSVDAGAAVAARSGGAPKTARGAASGADAASAPAIRSTSPGPSPGARTARWPAPAMSTSRRSRLSPTSPPPWPRRAHPLLTSSAPGFM